VEYLDVVLAGSEHWDFGKVRIIVANRRLLSYDNSFLKYSRKVYHGKEKHGNFWRIIESVIMLEKSSFR